MRVTETAAPGGRAAKERPRPRVHVFDTGSLVANRTFLRGEGFVSLLRRAEPVEFPALAYVLELEQGLMAIDTGLGAHVTAPRRVKGFPPAPFSARELGPQMREQGLDPLDVRTVVLTHLDWDHTGGLHHFPHAEVLLHRPEHLFGLTRIGRARYRPQLWRHHFTPTVYDLDPEPFGPFPESRALTDHLRILPIPGHSPGQVAVAFDAGDALLLFAADHMLRADWFTDDIAVRREVMLGTFAKRAARETTRRIEALVRSRATVLLPAHDRDAPRRLAALEVTRLA
jgi:N-acyl homoserine lactone hydrolase